ncbi:MAG TPA: AAA family ATPase [Planctomycetota bacterium]|nr:AAA family ATPase [Planctomycetota bacterium]
MYLDHWKLRLRPFRDAPDTRFFFHSGTHDAALAELLYAVDERLAVALLTGPFGSGKTLVLRALLGGLSGAGGYRTAVLTGRLTDPAETVLAAARALGVEDLADGVSEERLRGRLEEHLGALAAESTRPVLVIDDAQAVDSPAVWEALRGMLAIPGADGPALTLILSGGPQLLERVAAVPGFGERVRVCTTLVPLSDEESLDYILHRLACAGSASGIFTRRAAEDIARLSGGLPSRINHLADLALAAAFGLGLKAVGPEVVAMAAKEATAVWSGAARGAPAG